jgi:DNA-binding transcriptional MerR regulator
MTVEIDGQIYYRAHEVCAMNHISKSTLLRWIRKGIIEDASRRDWRGWRLFTQSDLQKIKEVANTILYR